MAVPWSDVLTGIGLLMNMIGVGALTLTNIFGSKPIRMWWYLIRHVDRDNPEKTTKEPPVEIVSPVGGGFAGLAKPTSPNDYDRLNRMVRNQSLGEIGLVGGFFFQFIALFV